MFKVISSNCSAVSTTVSLITGTDPEIGISFIVIMSIYAFLIFWKVTELFQHTLNYINYDIAAVCRILYLITVEICLDPPLVDSCGLSKISRRIFFLSLTCNNNYSLPELFFWSLSNDAKYRRKNSWLESQVIRFSQRIYIWTSTNLETYETWRKYCFFLVMYFQC